MNFLKTKLFKKTEQKTRESRFLEKTGKKGFQGFLIWGKGHRSTVNGDRSSRMSSVIGQEGGHQSTVISQQNSQRSTVTDQQGGHRSSANGQQKNPPSLPLQKGGDQSVELFSKTSLPSNSSLFSKGGPRGFLNKKRKLSKLAKLCFNTKLRTTLSLVLVVALFTTLLFLQNQKTQESNNPITVSSINSQEQFEIKKEKDSLSFTSQNSSITLNQIKTKKQNFEIYSHPPKASNLKTQVVYFDDSDLNYQQAEITLKKTNPNQKVNSVVTCKDQDFNPENQTCNNWQSTNLAVKDQGDSISFQTTHFSAYAGVYIEHTSSQLLNENREFIEETFQQTKAKDNNWITVPKNHYLRVEFEEALTNQRDITLYVRLKEENQTPANIQIFEKNQDKTINTFQNITKEGWQKVYLETLENSQTTFDLQTDQDVEIDFVIDPTCPSGMTGTGISGDACVVTTCDQLQAINTDATSLGLWYELGGNVDCSATSTWNSDGAGGYYGFEPISTFTGNFDGQGYEISGLYIDRGGDRIGLFGIVDNMTTVIENVGLVGVNIRGGNYVGGLIGYSENVSSVEGNYTTGAVHGTGAAGSVGGLIGRNMDSSVSNCYSNVTVTSVDNGGTGGLIGNTQGGSVSNSYATGNVQATNNVGGLIGNIYGTLNIFNCYATGDVLGTGSAAGIGGLIGYNDSASISNSYATGDVETYDNGGVGGLVGIDNTAKNHSNNYATGNVTGTDKAGGLMGEAGSSSIVNSYSLGVISGGGSAGGLIGSGGTCTNSFWNTETSGQSTSACGATGKTTAEMKNVATFTDETTEGLTTAWDFWQDPNDDTGTDDTWLMIDYPQLNILTDERVIISSSPKSLTAGAKSSAYTIEFLDADNQTANTTSDIEINLSSTSSSYQFQNLAGDSITSVTIPSGSSSIVFYYLDNEASASGNPTITITPTNTDYLGYSQAQLGVLELTSTISSPTNNSHRNDNVAISGTASAAPANLSTIEILLYDQTADSYWDGTGWSGTSASWQTATDTDTWSYSGLDLTDWTTGHTYTVQSRATDSEANVETPATATTFSFDNTPPSISSITSDKANGEYNSGETIDITLTFDEIVTSSTGLTLTLDTTGTVTIPAWATATDTVSGTYTVGGAHTSSDLNVSSISGTITDQPGNSLLSGQTTSIPFTTDSNYIHEDATKTVVEGGAVSLKNQFLCGTNTITYEGQIYTTVQIGDQCWLGENLNVGTRINGTIESTDNSTMEKYCYDDNEANCDTYGGLYQWDEAMQYTENEGTQGICPDGWHIPTDIEWHTLESDFVSGTGTCDPDRSASWDCSPTGTALKTGGSSGFEALLAGRRFYESSFISLSSNALFWSSSVFESSAWSRSLSSSTTTVNRSTADQLNGYSVRCLQNLGVSATYPVIPSHLTTTNSSQKDTSTWTAVSGITLTQTTPTNTDLKYLVSFDGRSTWRYWDGDSWETSTLDDLQTNGMSKTTLEGLSSANWSSTNGFSPGTLDFAIDLSTTDNTATPELDNIEIEYSYADPTYLNSTVDPAAPTGSNLADNSALVIDNTDPTSAITNPDGTTLEYSNMASITGTSSDTNTVNNVDITIQNTEATSDDYEKYWDGDSWEVAETWLTGSGTTTWSYDSSSVVWEIDSEYTIKSRATDLAGNQETPGTGKSFTYVNAHPEITINSATKTNTDLVVNYDVTDTGSTETTISLVYDSGATLSSGIDNSSTDAIEVSDITKFPTSGTILLKYGTGDSTRYEYISYTGITGNTLTGITRSQDSTLGYSHESGAIVRIKAVTTSGDVGIVTNGTSKTLTWTPATDINFYSATQTVSVVSIESASANKVGLATSSELVFDSVTPVINSAFVDATTTTDNLTFNVSDDTALEMMVSLESDFDGASWETYSANDTQTLTTPDTVYVKFKDSQGNTTATQTLTTPNIPGSVMVQDISNASADQYRLFIAWSVVDLPTPGFGSYDIYHSTDGTSYSLEDSVTDISENYYSDISLEAGTSHYYKILAKDSNGNQSNYSSVVQGTANGVQDGDEPGTSIDPPVITNVTSSNITSSSATITWDTNEIADSLVKYITTTGGDFSEAPFQGQATMADNSSGVGAHSVTLTNLQSETTYYFQVESTDADGDTQTNKEGTNGYTFTTLAGGDTTPPTITEVTTGIPNPTSVTIAWTTNENANSLIDFGETTSYSNTQGDSLASTTSHSVTLTSLTPDTTYYYQVKSQDSSGNLQVDNNSGSSYSFTTDSAADPGDTTAPTISSISVDSTTSTTATISWTTNEDSDSIVGFSQDESYTQEQGSTTLTQSHSLTLTGLTPETTYYFQVKSRDANGNLATETDATTQTFTTDSGSDTTPPIILSGPTVSSLTSSSAVVSWTTDENSNSYVDFGTVSGTYTETQGKQGDSTTSHSVTLNNLTSGETYYYKVRSEDSSDNQVSSAEYSFTTTSSPTISAVSLDSNTDTTATITFATSSNAYGYIDYGTTSETYTETKGGLTLTDTHSINLTGLTPATEYFYQVRIKDIYGNYTLDDTENSFTTNSGDAPTLSSFTSTTEDGYYQATEEINLTATYSEAISSGSITVELDTGSEVELTGTGTTLTGTYTIQSGENSSDLTVSRIVVQNVCDSDSNCLTGVTLPASNLADTSAIVVDTTNPTITGFSPITDSTVSTDNFNYTLSETITSGTLTVTRTGGTADGSSPHSFNLTELTTGAHTSIDPGMTLVNGTIYTFELTVTDLAGNTNSTSATGVTYDTDSLTLNSFSSNTDDNIYGPGSTINLTATYSKDLISGVLTVTLDTGASVTLDTINANTISGTYTVGSTGSGEDSSDLTVTSIDSVTVEDSLGNTPTTDLPASNLADTSTIVIDTTAPTFTVTSPTNNSTIDSLTTSSDLSYSIDENLNSASINIALVSGIDSSAPHLCTLSGDNLNSGDYLNFNTTNCDEGEITLTNESVYNFTFNGEDIAGNSQTQTITGVKYDVDAPASITISEVTVETFDSNSATITFTTSESSYGYLDYGTTESYGKVQGNNVTPTTTHSITLNGLTSETLYYFKPRIKSIAGDYILGAQDSFTTTEEPEEPSEEGPTISNVRVDADSLGYNKATVKWSTDEEANSAVTYGTDLEYGYTHGDDDASTTSHSVTLPDLTPETPYFFKVRSMNAEKNFTTDDNEGSAYTFTTLSGSQADQISEVAQEIETMISNLTYTEQEIMDAISNIEAISISSTGPNETITNNIDVTIDWETNKDSKGKVVYKQEDEDNWTTREEIIETDSGYTDDHSLTIKNLEPQTTYEYYVISTSILGNQVTSNTNTFTTGETPKISNVTIQNTTLNEATISWTTNSITTSILEYGTSTDYNTEEQKTSSTDENNQTVLLEELTPGQEYHFRIKGIDEDEETVTTNDYTFTTSALPEISNLNTTDISTETVTISWNTNTNTDSLVEYSFLGEDQGTSQGVLEATTNHSITLEKLIPGSSYQATVYSKDQFGNQAQSELFTFQLQEDNNPPQIQNISSDTTMYPGEELKIQTVIAWVTNKDSYSALAYRKGTGRSNPDLTEKLQEIVREEQTDTLKTNYQEWKIIKKPALTKNHLFILTDFDPNSIYQYKVISVDKQGNSSTSKDFSFLTPNKQESIFDLIIANFEETFGWMKRMR
jgi:uncharacterized protein (TIGR02145 family)